jgi:MocE subfamily Rieske [2Fe-2S] domain protein
MNYHIEHHMFPLVPYHALPKLHEIVKNDCPPPHSSLWSCWQEIIPTVARQTEDPGHHVERTLPKSCPTKNIPPAKIAATFQQDGWTEICPSDALQEKDVLRFDQGEQTYAIYRDEDGNLYATEGICTHGRTHLAGGLVIGKMIECPKHNGRFNLEDGSPARKPVCKSLHTHDIKEENGKIKFRSLVESSL